MPLRAAAEWLDAFTTHIHPDVYSANAGASASMVSITMPMRPTRTGYLGSLSALAMPYYLRAGDELLKIYFGYHLEKNHSID